MSGPVISGKLFRSIISFLLMNLLLISSLLRDRGKEGGEDSSTSAALSTALSSSTNYHENGNNNINQLMLLSAADSADFNKNPQQQSSFSTNISPTEGDPSRHLLEFKNGIMAGPPESSSHHYSSLGPGVAENVDRGKIELTATTSWQDRIDYLSSGTHSGVLRLHPNSNEWRFSDNPQKQQGNEPPDSRLLNCSTLRKLSSPSTESDSAVDVDGVQMSSLTSGWTKEVFQLKLPDSVILPDGAFSVDYCRQSPLKTAENGQEEKDRSKKKNVVVAIKLVHLNGQQIRECTDALSSQQQQSTIHPAAAGILRECYAQAAAKIIKEISLLKLLQHSSIIKILGYCIPESPLTLQGGMVGLGGLSSGIPTIGDQVSVVTEIGKPIDIIQLLQLNWENRLRVSRALSQLLDHLANGVKGASFSINDFRTQQFVHDYNGDFKIVDLDDFSSNEPPCTGHADCWRAFKNESTLIQCQNGFCQGFNEASNIQKSYKLFFLHLLPANAPYYLKDPIQQLLQRMSQQTISAAEIRSEMNKIVDKYANFDRNNAERKRRSALYDFKVLENRDLPGVGDYSCINSMSQIGCSLSVVDVQEAIHICHSQSVCTAFVWTNQTTWTGRHVVHFKNELSEPVVDPVTTLYIKQQRRPSQSPSHRYKQQL